MDKLSMLNFGFDVPGVNSKIRVIQLGAQEREDLLKRAHARTEKMRLEQVRDFIASTLVDDQGNHLSDSVIEELIRCQDDKALAIGVLSARVNGINIGEAPNAEKVRKKKG